MMKTEQFYQENYSAFFYPAPNHNIGQLEGPESSHNIYLLHTCCSFIPLTNLN